MQCDQRQELARRQCLTRRNMKLSVNPGQQIVSREINNIVCLVRLTFSSVLLTSQVPSLEVELCIAFPQV